MILTSVWIAGLILGAFVSFVAVNALRDLFPVVLSANKSMVSVLLPTILPFLLSALAVYFSIPWLLSLICGLKAFCFGFCGLGLCIVYGQCSWLLQLLFMFTDLCTLPILLFYWLRYFMGGNRPSRFTNICFGSALFVICSIDRCIISPFAMRLLLF